MGKRHVSTRDARSKFIHYKIVHRYYFKPMKLFKMGLTQDRKCWKCHKDFGTFLHTIWDFPMVLPFWKVVLKNIEGWLKRALPAPPQLCLLMDKALMPPGLTKAELRLTVTGFIVAAQLILRNWKSPCKPNLVEWFKLMSETAAFEKMIARVNNVICKTSQVWDVFLDYIRGVTP